MRLRDERQLAETLQRGLPRAVLLSSDEPLLVQEAAGQVPQLCYEGGGRLDVTVRIWRCDVGYEQGWPTQTHKGNERKPRSRGEGVILIHADQGPRLSLGILAVRPGATYISVSVVR